VPEKPGSITPGCFILSFFNPESGTYKTVQTDEISFVAKGDGVRQEGRYDEEKEKRVDFNPLYAVLIVFALAVIIVFVVIWERQRYRLVAHGEEHEHESEDIHSARPEQDYHAEAARCIDRGDGEGFLKAAEKSLELAQKGLTGDGRDKMQDAFTRIKEEIYAYKFGRGTISADDMKRILREIEDVKGLK